MNPFAAAAGALDLPTILHRIQQYAASELGREAVRNIAPSSDLELISASLNRVTEMKRLLEGEGAVPMEGIADVRIPIRQAVIENNILSTREIALVGSTLAAGRTIKAFIEKRKEYLPYLFNVTADISILKELEFNITQAIDENFEVRDTASRELRSIRQSIVDKQSIIRRALEKILRATAEQGMVRDEIITTRDGRMVIPIKAELKNRFPGFIHSTSATGQTVFIEPSETLTLNNEITELFFREKREVERILRTLTAQIGAVADPLLVTIGALTLLDTEYAKARYSIEVKGNKPFLKTDGALVLRVAYHPILLLKHARETIVPLELEIGGRYRTLLITGPNAGGKTVALKSVGLLALMVQSGIHIPVSADSEFPIFQQIFVLIGDNQSIENDLSTYSSQVLQVKTITEAAGDETLILIDEIGSNTDPTEGGAFAAAVLDHLNASGAFTIATSHQASLKAFVHSTEGMENGAMEFDQTTLTPTYRFKPGIPGSSYALEIAHRLGISERIVAKSRTMLGDQKARLEQLILELENRSQELSQRLQSTDAEMLRYKELSASYETKLQTLNKEVKALKAKAIEDARAIIDKAASTVESTVREIRTTQAQKEVVRSGKERIARLEKEVESLEKEITGAITAKEEPLPQLQINDLVVLKSGGQTGTVVSLPDKNGNLHVAFNSIKARVNISNIRSVSRKEARRIDAVNSVMIEKEATTEVDVRGMYGDEAVDMVDKFIDDATLSGLHRLEIIHGHGTGVLRKRIHELLQSDSRIKTYRFGERHEGGAGVTIVEIA